MTMPCLISSTPDGLPRITRNATAPTPTSIATMITRTNRFLIARIVASGDEASDRKGRESRTRVGALG